ncbi:hypothetical protein TARUN_5244 [Trichoderma arundinaceum]|uniref:Maleylacetate reductase n=1 Tax=Trichoderma arundinaceum TaxID=490622 RepID=A0A395NMC9_TRIAR|nr:hypothetical protein TARUN_5244 [Trichoderma arundinaceum]
MTSAHKSGITPKKPSRSTPSRPRSHPRYHSRRASNSLDPKPESPRVVFGHGAIASLPTELNKLCLSLPLIIYSPSRLFLANRILSLLPNLDASIIDPDTYPGSATLSGRDSVISVGGPRAVAMARRISLKLSIPHICIPTMYSGAAGDLPPLGNQIQDHDDLKKPEEDDDVHSDHENTSLPTVIIYDKRLTESRIKRFSVSSGAYVTAEAEAEAEVGTATAFSGVVDNIDVDASTWRSAKSSTAQWSYIHLPGV